MRVRGSFYMAKKLEKPIGKSGAAGADSKSPRQKKLSPNRLNLPKKKQKLRLEPLGPRTVAARPFVTAEAQNADNAAELQEDDIPKVSEQEI